MREISITEEESRNDSKMSNRRNLPAVLSFQIDDKVVTFDASDKNGVLHRRS